MAPISAAMSGRRTWPLIEIDRRVAEHQSGERRVVVAMAGERGGQYVGAGVPGRGG